MTIVEKLEKSNHQLECLRCGTTLMGKQRKFCSDRCRRNFYYHNTLGVKERDSLYAREYREKNVNKLKTHREKFKINGNYKKMKKEYNRRERIKFPEKHSARRKDYLKREKNCQLCESEKMLEFHHTDYRLRRGITLCVPCHKNFHKEVRLNVSKKIPKSSA